MSATRPTAAASGSPKPTRTTQKQQQKSSLANGNVGESTQRNRRNQELRVSFVLNNSSLQPRQTRKNEPAYIPFEPAPLIPDEVFREDSRPPSVRSQGGATTHRSEASATHVESGEQDEMEDLARNAVLIYPKPIDDLRRFRLLFVALLLFISSSTQGVHSLFGVMLFERTYLFTVEQMMIVYLCGSAFGMFVFPFGVVYDWFGPRPVIVMGTVLTALGHLLFALMFRGDIAHTVTNCSIFYAIMSWGCYALDVAVLPSLLTHMPRDRGQPTGILKTFSGLGSSFISCLFRGFFNNHFDNLMWFMFAMTIVFGAIGTWYLEDAPYVCNRWRRRHASQRLQLRCYLIRNRYMSQLMPRRRYFFVTGILVLLNFYLTIQAVTVAYKADVVTMGQYRGIAIGSIVIVLLLLILVIPVRAIDGPNPQDEEVIEAAKNKEEELRMRQEERYRQEWQQWQSGGSPQQGSGSPATTAAKAGSSKKKDNKADATQKSFNQPVSPGSPALRRTVTNTTFQQSRPLIEVDIPSSGDDELGLSEGDTDQLAATIRGSFFNASMRPGAQPPHRDGHEPVQSSDGESPLLHARVTSMSFHHGRMDAAQSPTTDRLDATVNVQQAEPSTYANPYVETITVCGEVFVTPVYQTTFLQSLTYFDLWLITWTTMCMWGVGLTMTANWNIEVMLQARYAAMDYKTYILVAAMSGVCTAGGRVALGVYEQIIHGLKSKAGITVLPTFAYPIASVGMFIAMIFWIALPGDKVLVLAYLLGPAFYGLSTSMTIYVLGTIYDRDIGMHYGFCFLGAAIGMVFFFRLAWYDTYKMNATLTPLGVRCIGQRKCMNRAIIIYLCVTFSSIITSLWVHLRYKSLVEGKLNEKRIIVPIVKRLLSKDETNNGEHAKDKEEEDNDNECVSADAHEPYGGGRRGSKSTASHEPLNDDQPAFTAEEVGKQ